MRIECHNLHEAILSYIAVCGEITRENLESLTGYRKSYLDRILSVMKSKEKIIKSYKYPNGTKVYRIRDAFGLPVLNEVSSELPKYYEFNVGKKDNRFKSSAQMRVRIKNSAALQAMLIQNSVITNLASIILPSQLEDEYFEPLREIYYETIFSSNNYTVPFEEIYPFLASGQKYYFSSKVVNQQSVEYRDTSFRVPIRAFTTRRMYGILTRDDFLYAVYCAADYEEVWRQDVETFARNQLEHLKKKVTGKSGVPAIVFTDNMKIIRDILMKPQVKSPKKLFRPYLTYDDVYVLPFNNTGRVLQDLLLTEDFRRKIAEKILGDSVINSSRIDGYEEDKEVVILLESNISQIMRLKLNPNVITRFYCHPWQKDALLEYFKGQNIEIAEVPEEEFLKLALNIID